MHLDKLPRKSVASVSCSHQTGLAGVALGSLHSSGDLPQILMPVWRTSYYLEPSPLPFTSYLFILIGKPFPCYFIQQCQTLNLLFPSVFHCAFASVIFQVTT